MNHIECHLCGDPILDGDDVHEDHVLPRAHGGTDDPSNLRMAHAICNLVKGARLDLTVEQIRERRLTGVPIRRPVQRKLHAVSLQVSPTSKAELEARSAKKHVAVGTLLRLILLGEEPPLQA